MSDLGCPPNAALAFDFLVGKGLSHVQAAGVVGNLQWESRLNPLLEALDTNKLMSRGIAMWQPPRWQNLLEFAGTGRDPWALDTQLEFLWYELTSMPSFGLAPLLASTTIDAATRVFQDRFEHPQAALAHTDKRIELANAAFFACPRVRPPTATRYGVVAAAAGVVALVAATGYGIYKALSAHTRAPELPEPEPRPPRPIFPPIAPAFRREP